MFMEILMKLYDHRISLMDFYRLQLFDLPLIDGQTGYSELSTRDMMV